jgi:hypothetical protein
VCIGLRLEEKKFHDDTGILSARLRLGQNPENLHCDVVRAAAL